MAQTSSAFELNHSFFVKEINCEIQEYTHTETKAKHYHILPLTPFNNENSFTVSLKTIPQDSKGVAHILEHTVLCGSEKYPVKDPFFKMLTRSAATFMNAMTGPDYTVYPFATQNDKDYENLLQVYLDSVFHSNLSELDFLQEGWRFEYPQNDTSKQLEYKGVVLNEMRGAMGSEVRDIYQNMLNHIFKDTVYRHNSGGDPADITKLSYQELKDFYATYYHPSNSVFFTYGTYPVEKTQAFIAQALANFKYKNVPISQSTYIESPEYCQSRASYRAEHFNPEVPEGGDNHLILSWLCGDSVDLQESYEMKIFSEMLASPESKLQKYLDQEHILLSDINGYLNQNRQSLYLLGVKNIPDNELVSMREKLLAKLQEVKTQEFSKEKMHSFLDNIEISIKEQKAGRMPYSIDLSQAIQKRALAGLDIQKTFEIEEMFKNVRAKINDGTLISSIFDKYIQSSCVKEFISSANSEVGERKLQKEKEILLEREKNLTDSQKHQIVKKAKMLAQKQNQEAAKDSAEVLPKLNRADINAKIDESLFSSPYLDKNFIHYENKSGVAYAQLYFGLPFSGQAPYDLLVENAYYSILNTHYAYRNLSIEQSDIERSKHLAEYDVDTHLYQKHLSQTNANDKEHVVQLCVMGKNLDTKAPQMFETLCDSFFTARFDDKEQMYYVVSSYMDSIKDYSHLGPQMVKTAITQDLDATAYLTAQGLTVEALQKKFHLCERILSTPDFMDKFMLDVAAFHQDVLNHNKPHGPVLRLVSQESTKPQIQAIFEEKIKTYMGVDIRQNAVENTVIDTLSHLDKMGGTSIELRQTQNELNDKAFVSTQRALLGPETVAYNFRAYKIDNISIPESAALSVAAKILDSEYLHKLIREQGSAYGANCGLQNNVFIFSSYRDPNTQRTYDNFDKAIHSFLSDDISPALVEDTIIRVVSNINSIQDNRAKIAKSFEQDRTNKKEIRQLNLEAILNVTPSDMKKVVEKYLANRPCQNYTYCGESQKAQLLANQDSENGDWLIEHITDIQSPMVEEKKNSIKAVQ